jgi:DNA-directed RNA polymerase subunit K/omega
MTSPIIRSILSKYEEAKIIGLRMEQLARNAPPTVPIGTETDIKKIAYMELEAGKLPFKIVRTQPDGKKVIVQVKDLVKLSR